jgi:hypothetical protein
MIPDAMLAATPPASQPRSACRRQRSRLAPGRCDKAHPAHQLDAGDDAVQRALAAEPLALADAAGTATALECNGPALEGVVEIFPCAAAPLISAASNRLNAYVLVQELLRMVGSRPDGQMLSGVRQPRSTDARQVATSNRNTAGQWTNRSPSPRWPEKGEWPRSPS